MVKRNLIKKMFRDMKQYKDQFIAIALVILIGSFFYAGFSNFYRSLDIYANDYFAASNLADLWVYYSDIEQDGIDMLNSIDGVQSVEARQSFTINQSINDLKTTLKTQTLTESINNVTVVAGSAPTGTGQIAIDGDYAHANNIQLGDVLSFTVDSNKYDLVVSGFCESAEYAIKSRDSSDYPPNHSEYGIAYVSKDTAHSLFGATIYNDILIVANGAVSLSEIESEIEELAKEHGESYLFTLQREANLSYSQLTNEINQLNEYAKIFPIIFYGVAIVISFLTMSRIVEAQRVQIGLMKALGASSLKIILHYASYAFLVGLVGGLLGAIAGAYILPTLFLDSAMKIITMPNLSISIHISYVVRAVIISVCCGVLACLLSARKILKENAAQAMRMKPPKSAKGIAIEKLTVFWGKIDYSDKLILRNIFINKRRTIFSAVGIIFCVALLVIAFGYKGSRDALIEKQYTEVYKYDMSVSFSEPVSLDSITAIDGLEYASLSAQTEVTFNNAGDKRIITLTALSSDDLCIRHLTTSGSQLNLNDQTIIISQSFADSNNLSIGDTVSLKLIDAKYGGISIDTEIGGISVQYLNQEIYCTFTMLESKGVLLPTDTVLTKFASAADTQNAYSYFSGEDNVLEVKTLADLRAATERGLESLYSMIIIIIICATVLSGTALYNISIINIQERIREFATLKVLGCQSNRINKLIFKENIFLTAFAIIVGIPLGLLAYVNIIQIFTIESMSFPIKIAISSFVWPMVITMVITILSNLLLRKKVRCIDMIESLKANE